MGLVVRHDGLVHLAWPSRSSPAVLGRFEGGKNPRGAGESLIPVEARCGLRNLGRAPTLAPSVGGEDATLATWTRKGDKHDTRWLGERAPCCLPTRLPAASVFPVQLAWPNLRMTHETLGQSKQQVTPYLLLER